MRIGFDLDGVLCDIDIVTLHLIHKLSPDAERVAEKYYYVSRKPLLNPALFMNEDDECFVITGRHAGLISITEAWCARHVPNAKGVYVVGPPPSYYHENARVDNPDIWKKYLEDSVKSKVDKIKELNIGVYIDDNPTVVKRLREELPDIPIIQYGGRL